MPPTKSIATIIAELHKQRQTISASVADFELARQRSQKLRGEWPNENRGPIVYWMYRDQRVQDNWAFLFAQKLSTISNQLLVACFCVPHSQPNATLRSFDFMMKGLKEVNDECRRLKIPFCLLSETAHKKCSSLVCDFAKIHKASAIVCDFCPLRTHTDAVRSIQENLENENSQTALFRVDAHNIIPVWHTSDHLEFAAYTIRRKIHSLLPDFLTEFPPLIAQTTSIRGNVSFAEEIEEDDFANIYNSIRVDETVRPVQSFTAGYTAGIQRLYEFINTPPTKESGLSSYENLRNNPNHPESVSNLSPYFNYGQISIQRAVLSVKRKEKSPGFKKSVEGFIEEAVVRRELADNYCFYQPHYDSLDGAWTWAKTTLRTHKKDKRPFLYTLEQFEKAATHDGLWNAAQLEMIETGKMHGFMRMYWAKKILEWSKSPKEAIEIAIELNDKYELDGRDPNGYVGVMWSICGVHDHGFAERDVFGKIRCMTRAGCTRKFNVQEYIDRFQRK